MNTPKVTHVNTSTRTSPPHARTEIAIEEGTGVERIPGADASAVPAAHRELLRTWLGVAPAHGVSFAQHQATVTACDTLRRDLNTLRSGADATPVKAGEWPSAAQLWHQLLNDTPQQRTCRLSALRAGLVDLEQATQQMKTTTEPVEPLPATDPRLMGRLQSAFIGAAPGAQVLTGAAVATGLNAVLRALTRAGWTAPPAPKPKPPTIAHGSTYTWTINPTFTTWYGQA